jgi:hypothetical protein
MYNVLTPKYHKTGETVTTPRGETDVYAVTWRVLGIAFSMEDAKRRFGGYPVLEPI